MAAWLLFALLPMLTFAGHWPETIDIPGTNHYLALPFAASHAHGDDHGGHCHADSAGCSDTPAPVATGFAVLNESLLILGAGALLIAAGVLANRAPESRAVAPRRRPPKGVLTMHPQFA